MKVDIRDAEALRVIPPIDAAFYLSAAGWKQIDLQPGRATVWRQTVNGDIYEILLPMDHGLRNYALRMGELLQLLAEAEDRSQTEVYSDLLTITSDVTRIRIEDPELKDGTLSIEENAIIAQKAKDLVLAAACAATERRPVWHSRKPSQAVEHVRKVRIGQSERGSYVITVINRVTPLLHTQRGELFETVPPYERQVTQTLAESLIALDRAAEQAALTQKTSAFDEAVVKGVNANLCDAVVGFWNGEDSQRNLDFSFHWSPARPAPELPRRISISGDRIPVIREAGRLMREHAPVTDFELLGAVVKLERPEGSPIGKVTVMGLLDDRQVRVATELDDHPYHQAVTAHDQGKMLRILGTLTKDGRSYVLRYPRDVIIIDEE